jgi:hypothetical protein
MCVFFFVLMCRANNWQTYGVCFQNGGKQTANWCSGGQEFYCLLNETVHTHDLGEFQPVLLQNFIEKSTSVSYPLQAFGRVFFFLK